MQTGIMINDQFLEVEDRRKNRVSVQGLQVDHPCRRLIWSMTSTF